MHSFSKAVSDMVHSPPAPCLPSLGLNTPRQPMLNKIEQVDNCVDLMWWEPELCVKQWNSHIQWVHKNSVKFTPAESSFIKEMRRLFR